jgi:phage terminase small subunit
MASEPLNPKQELFCQYYVKNRETISNATLSYAFAYGYNLSELSKERKRIEGTIDTEDSEYQKAEHTCAVNGSDLLRNTDIQNRIRELFNELLRDDVVDGELAKLIIQDVDWDVKISSIREYNKLKSRITDKLDHTTNGKEIQFAQLSDEQLNTFINSKIREDRASGTADGAGEKTEEESS